MKPKELFINWQERSDRDNDGRYFVEASNICWPTKQDGTGCFKVREVSPALDAAYAECEGALSRIENGDEMSHLCNCPKVARLALAALRKARE